jgi:hypothetical protein
MIKHKLNGVIDEKDLLAYKPGFEVGKQIGTGIPFIMFILRTGGGMLRWEFDSTSDRDNTINVIDKALAKAHRMFMVE